MKDACISVGVSKYKDATLTSLPGTDVDAKRVLSTLTDFKYGGYDEQLSRLLLNPTREQVRAAIAEAAYSAEVETLTIFFAGHGGVEGAGYFLCCFDCDSSKFAYSALSLTDIFQILIDAPTRHVNIVIDACQAGGLAQDIPTLSKNFEFGTAGGLSVSVLAMSSRNEGAGEDATGGIGTNALLNVVRGDVDSGTNKEVLSLSDVAQAIKLPTKEQTPSYWSFNLSGAPKFCSNVYAQTNRADEVFALPKVAANSSSGVSGLAIESIWKAYVSCAEELDCRHLYGVLHSAVSELHSSDLREGLLLGLFDGFRQRVKLGEDLMAPSKLASIFVVLADCLSDEKSAADYFLNMLSEEFSEAAGEILKGMEEDHLYLVRGAGGFCEFFVLPLRISSLAAWCLSCDYISALKHNIVPTASKTTARILELLEKDYSGSYELMSERQAVPISVISALGASLGFERWCDEYIGCLYNSFHRNNGKVSRADIEPELVYDFLRHRIADEKPDFERFCSRPTEVLFVLLAHFWSRGELETVRYDLRELDGVTLGTFIPNSYCHFGGDRIEEGSTIHFNVGFEVFTIKELDDFFTQHFATKVAHAMSNVEQNSEISSMLASLIYEDRLAWGPLAPMQCVQTRGET